MTTSSSSSNIFRTDTTTPNMSALVKNKEVRRINLVKQTEVTFSCTPVLNTNNAVETTNGFAASTNTQVEEEATRDDLKYQNDHEEIIEMPVKTHESDELNGLKVEHDPTLDQMIAE